MTYTDAEGAASIGNVMIPVPDVSRARDFYVSALGLSVKFTDQDRYVALKAGSTTLALVSPEEDLADGRVAAAFKVDDVERVLKAVRDAGGTVIDPPTEGPHEIRAVFADPDGNLSLVYAPIASR